MKVGKTYLIKNGEYEQAIAIFTELGDYKDAEDKIIRLQNESENYKGLFIYFEKDEDFDIQE